MEDNDDDDDDDNNDDDKNDNNCDSFGKRDDYKVKVYHTCHTSEKDVAIEGSN